MKLTQEVENILIGQGWSREYIDKFVDVIESIALDYDKKTGCYPENKYEGLGFLIFCTGRPDPMPVNYLNWKERLKVKNSVPIPSMKISTEVIEK